MEQQPESDDRALLSRLPRALQWILLLLGSAAAGLALELLGLPAALLIGPMLAGIAAGVLGATIRPPAVAAAGAQAVIGCLIAASIEPEIVAAFVADWPLFGGVVIATVAASSLLGYLVSRWKVLPGTTAVWGSAPGAATAMVLMAGAFGADQRLVAFMQYLRVLMVTVAAALIARLWVDVSAVEPAATEWFPALDPAAFATTVAVAAGGGLLGWLLRLPSPFFMGAVLIGLGVHLGAGLPLQLPEWLLGASYALIGWAIGLNFNRSTVGHAARALPQVVLSILALIAFCGGLGWVLAQALDLDPLTAYLATSPGGMDSVAIIAAASDNVNISVIMAVQMARFLFVLLFGAPIARLVARSTRI